VCSAAANGGTLEGSVCVLPSGITTAPNNYSATIAVSNSWRPQRPPCPGRPHGVDRAGEQQQAPAGSRRPVRRCLPAWRGRTRPGPAVSDQPGGYCVRPGRCACACGAGASHDHRSLRDRAAGPAAVRRIYRAARPMAVPTRPNPPGMHALAS